MKIPPVLREQSGFTLLELTLVLAIGSAFMLMLSLSIQVHVLQLATQSMAERYRAVQTAMNRYVMAFRPSLSAAPIACSEPIYQVGDAAMAPKDIAAGSCSAILNNGDKTFSVFNVLQPSVDELQALGFLESGQGTGLQLAHAMNVFQPSLAGASAALAAARLGVLVRRVCSPEPCTQAVPYEIVVYNLQPYRLDGGNWLFGRRDQVNALFAELGEGALSSQDGPASQLVAARGQWRIVNPVRGLNTSLHGSVVALRMVSWPGDNTAWARRDGQSDIVGDWHFGQHRLEGVSQLQAQNLQGEALQLTGKAEMAKAMVQSAHVQALSVDSLRLPAAILGEGCFPEKSSLGIATDSGAVLVCHPQTFTWSSIAP